jgi:hypothetical protein
MPSFSFTDEAVVVNAEQAYASNRAKLVWGDSAFVLDQSDLSRKMFIVSAGTHPSIRAYGEGESWDEAFFNAGSSLFSMKELETQFAVETAGQVYCDVCGLWYEDDERCKLH